ncbi:universal stress protein [Mycolicibacterium sp. jd]|uniref:universal stress protein n=1 Tax=unclassified Mycolicibacterium TaxID=2636767 RepID=UPI00351BD34B
MAGQPVVVGVDGSPAAARALRWAAHEAVRRAAPLLIVHTCVLIPAAVPHATALGGYRNAVIEDSRSLLADAANQAREAAAGVVVDTALTSGSAAEQLIARSVAADLVVIGTRGLGGISSLVAGSVAVAVAAHGRCPVVVVRGAGTDDEPRQHRPVVVGFDGSSTSKAAIPFAFQAAAARGVAVVAVHVWMDFTIGSVSAAAALTHAWESAQAEQMALLSTELAEYRTRFPAVPVEQVILQDRPAPTLLRYAENAQLIVVGSRGRGGFRGLLLGSTSQALIHHAACPVAVVPPVWR